MGQRIDRASFAEADYARFGQRLKQCLTELSELLRRPGFGVGATTIGAELELFLVDDAGRPLARNEAVLAAVNDPRVDVEIDRFNLELNASPVLLAGRPFTAVGAELSTVLDRIDVAAARCGGRPALIGILPTLRHSDLDAAAMSAVARYQAINAGLRQLRSDDLFTIHIAGADELDLATDVVTVEGANTSFQIHLRVNPADFTRTYNAVQLASAPVLAVAGNSPTFLGKRLWDETRVALMKQSIDDRDGRQPRRRPARVALGTGWLRGGALELFGESVRLYPPLLPVLPEEGEQPAHSGAPALAALRLHQGTVWRWNRAIYDPADGGHLRIEMRALPSGPTVVDMLANAAFLLGLTLSLADRDPRWTYRLSFERAEHNFRQAARLGLDAELSWPFTAAGEVTTVPARDLVAELLPAAREGLIHAAVAGDEADRLLGVIAARVESGQTGAAWQRAVLADAPSWLDRSAALAGMFQRYLQHAAAGTPVHTWPIDQL